MTDRHGGGRPARRDGEDLTRVQFLRRAAALGVGASALGTLVGCGDGDDQTGSSGAGESGKSASIRGKTIRLLAIQPHAVAAKQLAAGFERQTGCKVKATIVPYDQVQQKATLDVQSGAAQFDVFDYWYTTIGALAADDVLEDLTSFVDGREATVQPGDYIPSVFDPYTLVDGKRYGLPFDGDTHVLFWNTRLFERAGLDSPKTWDDYVDAAEKITQDGKGDVFGCALLGQQAPIIIGSSYANRLGGYGGRFLQDGKPALDQPAAIEAARSMQAAARSALPTPLETAFDQALPAFLTGRVAMMEFWTDLAVLAEDPKQSKIRGQWDVQALPVGGSNTKPVASLNAGFGMGVSTASKEKDAARQFVEFATSSRTNTELISTVGSGIDPTRRSSLDSSAYRQASPKARKAASASLNGAFAWPTSEQSPKLMQKLSEELALLLQGKKQPDAAMSDVQVAWSEMLEA